MKMQRTKPGTNAAIYRYKLMESYWQVCRVYMPLCPVKSSPDCARQEANKGLSQSPY